MWLFDKGDWEEGIGWKRRDTNGVKECVSGRAVHPDIGCRGRACLESRYRYEADARQRVPTGVWARGEEEGRQSLKLRNEANLQGCVTFWIGLMHRMLEVVVRQFVTWLRFAGMASFDAGQRTRLVEPWLHQLATIAAQCNRASVRRVSPRLIEPWLQLFGQRGGQVLRGLTRQSQLRRLDALNAG
jgi:hypothetical protein